jgi:DNA-binding NarL/FixJ family response regulator
VTNARLQHQLATISDQITGRLAEIAELEPERDRLIRRALADGWTHAQIAETTGLSRSRIGQLALKR